MRNYKKEYQKLIDKCKAKGWTVKEVATSELKDYAGMNDEAAKKIGFRKLADDTILIDKGMSDKLKYETLNHEMIEMPLMEKKVPYWKAHCKALKLEKK